MNLDGAIQQLFRNAVNGVGYLLQDDSDGKGPYIKEWNLPDPQPTLEKLEAASIAYEAAAVQKQADRQKLENDFDAELLNLAETQPMLKKVIELYWELQKEN
jgi:hypothetical protein